MKHSEKNWFRRALCRIGLHETFIDIIGGETKNMGYLLHFSSLVCMHCDWDDNKKGREKFLEDYS